MIRSLTRRRALGLIGLGPVIAACASEPPRLTFPQLTYINLPPITFDAQGVEINNEVQPGPSPPHIENSIPVSPAWAAERWARDRLRVNGAGGRRVRVAIKSGSVIQANLARQTGIATTFTNQQSQRYDAEVEVWVEMLDDRGFRIGFASGAAKRSTSIPEDATLNTRDQTLYNLVKGLTDDLNTELDRNIKQFMPTFMA